VFLLEEVCKRYVSSLNACAIWDAVPWTLNQHKLPCVGGTVYYYSCGFISSEDFEVVHLAVLSEQMVRGQNMPCKDFLIVNASRQLELVRGATLLEKTDGLVQSRSPESRVSIDSAKRELGRSEGTEDYLSGFQW